MTADDSLALITDVVLRVSVDPGHSGLSLEYKIASDENGYTVTLSVSKPWLRPARSPASAASHRASLPSLQPENVDFDWSFTTEVLAKESWQVEEFLRKLSTELTFYDLTDLKSPYPFLHPTFYSFSCQNSRGTAHSFEYQIECSNHLDERYRQLVQAFDTFFERERVLSFSLSQNR